MAIPFTFSNLINIAKDVFFDGSTTVTGLAAMVLIWLVFVAVLVSITVRLV